MYDTPSLIFWCMNSSNRFIELLCMNRRDIECEGNNVEQEWN